MEVTRQITKHNFLVMEVADIPRIIKEAFFLARTGRPGERSRLGSAVREKGGREGGKGALGGLQLVCLDCLIEGI